MSVSSPSNIEVGFYPTRDNSLSVYVNQNGVCIFRRRVALVPELMGDGTAPSLAILRGLSLAVVAKWVLTDVPEGEV